MPHTRQLAALALVAALLLSALGWSWSTPAHAAGPALPNPILFVTQVPVPADFTSITAVFGNHKAALSDVARGGDLWIRYGDGTLKNLTRAAGFGGGGMQGANSIAVRDPSVFWDGTKAVFSMVIGAPTQRYQVATYHWQLYEITGLGLADTPVITKVPRQPANFNNISPIYGSDDRILFTTDRPRNGAAQLYPQLDEYEEAPTNTGIWSLDPATGDLFLLDHAPSGDFTPTLDSFGRVIFTRWDHLQRDQQTDSEVLRGDDYGTFNYSDESANAAALNSTAEVYPEARAERTDILSGTHLLGHSFNQFFPWMINEDGTEAETLNHIGRHELQRYFEPNFDNDANLLYFNPGSRPNQLSLRNFLQIKEDPQAPGRYVGTDAPEFATHAAGQIVTLSGAPSLNANQMRVGYLTHPDTANFTSTPSANHSGLYRDPLPLSNGTLVAVHTPQTDRDTDIGTSTSPRSRYDFRLKTLRQQNGVWVADQPLTPGLTADISYYSPDTLTTFSGQLWELNPVEVRARPRPPQRQAPLAPPEQQAFTQTGVAVSALQSYLRANNLALMVTRNVTTRDAGDKQQPFNLRVAGGGASTVGATGTVYDVAFMQIFQADQIRGIGYPNPRPGRRVLAQPLHDQAVRNPTVPGSPTGSVRVAGDGSVAAFVPARRALTWMLSDPSGQGVVRERYWLTFQPGEIRTCTSCHGLNTVDQAGHAPPANTSDALVQLLQDWQRNQNAAPQRYLPMVAR